MSTSIESHSQNQRDLRSEHRDYKRDKDSHSKWSNGARPSAGCRVDWGTMEALGGTESQRAMMRPRGKHSETSHQKKQQHNITKLRSHWEMPQGRFRAALQAKEEIKDCGLSQSLIELLPSQQANLKLSVSDDFKYSFDKSESPNRPLTLDIFIKTTGRETERMVEKEYEILDANGDALRGRKARQNLRKSRSNLEGMLAADEDDFELV